MKQVIVTGGRDYDDWAMVQDVLNLIDPDVVIQGGAHGADQQAKEWAELNGKKAITVEANWNLNGKSAGPLRNIEMIETYPDATVVAFPGGIGTANCVKEAVRRNRVVLQVHK